MDKSIYLAMNAANNMIKNQTIAANNLANVSTPGFRAQIESISSMPLEGGQLESRVYSQFNGTHADMSHGSLETTGNNLDVALNQDGWFAVQRPDGSEAYTRAGQFQLNTQGELLLPNGYQVLGDGGPIVIPPADKISIGRDGTISIHLKGEASEEVTILDRLRVVTATTGEIRRDDDGFFVPTNGAALPNASQVHVVSGALEQSNVNAIDALVQMMMSARAYETHMHFMKSVKEQDESLSRLMHIS